MDFYIYVQELSIPKKGTTNAYRLFGENKKPIFRTLSLQVVGLGFACFRRTIQGTKDLQVMSSNPEKGTLDRQAGFARVAYKSTVLRSPDSICFN
jgi:hypothetical protein